MEKQFDIVVIGSNVPSALHVYRATKAGLQVACFANNNQNKSIDNELLTVFRRFFFIRPVKDIKQNKIIDELKRIAGHLLLSTQLEEHLKLSIVELFLLRVYNLFGNNKIKVKKSVTKKGFYQLSYLTYKISVNRLWQTVLKSIDKTNYQVFDLDESDTLKDLINQKKVGKDLKKSDLAIIGFNKNTSIFTYSNSELKLEKTILWIDKVHSIRIIPWFEWVYFEIKSNEDSEMSLEKAFSLIETVFPEIKIEKEKVLTVGEKTGDFSNSTPVYKEINNRSQKYEPLIGSNFDFPYHPLRIMEYCDEKYDEAKHILQNPQYFKKLFYRYGTEIEKITYQAYEFWNQTKDIKKTWLMAEIWYVLNYEQCMSVNDFLYKHTEEWMNGKTASNKLIEILFEELTNIK